ncbi:hypothetical protein [Fusobacterium sp.]|uniref:hypothetical protein n=1 Tax=Fusobacterium sp. TaxID=68766 RepID=UPI002610B085|nr:hypothetical protein [Fusobacterium sp.]
MGFFDSLGKVMETAAKNNKTIEEVASNMSESELRTLYSNAKRNGDFLARGNAIKFLKRKYGYSDEDLSNI